MKYLFTTLLLFVIFSGAAQIDTATITFQQNNKQYFVRIGYNPNHVDSATIIRKFDTSYSSAKGIEVRYRDDIIKYYTGVAVGYIAGGEGLERQGKAVKVHLPIDYFDNDKFVNYLKRKLLK